MRRKKQSADIEELIQEILVDSYGEDEGFWAFCEAFAAHGGFPRDAFVAGQLLSVREVDYDGNVLRGLVAVCRTEDDEVHRIGLEDVVFPESTEAHRTLAAYRSWLGIPEPAPGGTTKSRRRHKATQEDLDLGAPLDLIVLNVKERAARCRIPGTERLLTLRSGDVWKMPPGALVTVRPRKQWSYAGHPYLSGDLIDSRIDLDALGLVPLELHDRGVWDPAEEYWGEEGEPKPDYALPIIARGPRRLYEMEQVLPGEDPDDPDEDPITRSVDLMNRGARDEAQRILMEVLEVDLRCLDAHAHLGNLRFDYQPEEALAHYEMGKAVGGLSLGADFDGVLDWGFVDNRPFLRCLQGSGLCLWRLGRFPEAEALFERMLWLNPGDNQGIRFLIEDVRREKPWDDGPGAARGQRGARWQPSSPVSRRSSS